MNKDLQSRWSRYRQRLITGIDRRLLAEKRRSERSPLASRLDRSIKLLLGWLLATFVLAYWLPNLLLAGLAAALTGWAAGRLGSWLRLQWLVQARLRQDTSGVAVADGATGTAEPPAQQRSGDPAAELSTDKAVCQEQLPQKTSWSDRVLHRQKAKAYFKTAAILLLFAWLFSFNQAVQLFYLIVALFNGGLAVACLLKRSVPVAAAAADEKP